MQWGWEKLQERFDHDKDFLWPSLSRLTSLLIVLNISLFFLTDLVIEQGYYYTFFSLGCLLAVTLMMIVPSGCMGRLWYYLVALFLEGVAAYFLIASVWYWVATGRG